MQREGGKEDKRKERKEDGGKEGRGWGERRSELMEGKIKEGKEKVRRKVEKIGVGK